MSSIYWKRSAVVLSVVTLLLTSFAFVIAQDDQDNKPYLVLEVEGDVFIRQSRSAEEVWMPLKALTPVRPDDVFDATNGRIVIQCDGEEIDKIEYVRNVTADCQNSAPPPTSIPGVKGNETASKPSLVYPRGDIMTAPTKIRWRAVDEATSYSVRFFWQDAQGQIQEQTEPVESSAVVKRGALVEWTLPAALSFPVGVELNLEIKAYNSSRMQPKSGTAGWNWQSARDEPYSYIRITPPSSELQEQLTALTNPWPIMRLYVRNSYWAEAIEYVESLSFGIGGRPAVWSFELGNLYRRLGLHDQALNEYMKTVQAARAEDNVFILNDTYKLLANYATLRAERWCYADAAQSYFSEISDTSSTNHLIDIKNTLVSSGIPVPTDCQNILAQATSS